MRGPASNDTTPLLNRVTLPFAVCTSNWFGTKVRLPKMHKIPPDFDRESSRSPAKSES